MVQQLRSYDRSSTPWLLVAFHGSPYHTYVKHYKVGAILILSAAGQLLEMEIGNLSSSHPSAAHM